MGLARPSYLEYRLDFVIRASRVSAPIPAHRLNAVENSLALLVEQWRAFDAFDVSTEIALSSESLAMLREWVGGEMGPRANVHARLEKYELAIDPSVTPGWIRVR